MVQSHRLRIVVFRSPIRTGTRDDKSGSGKKTLVTIALVAIFELYSGRQDTN